jgi:hypothetical protein
VETVTWIEKEVVDRATEYRPIVPELYATPHTLMSRNVAVIDPDIQIFVRCPDFGNLSQSLDHLGTGLHLSMTVLLSHFYDKEELLEEIGVRLHLDIHPLYQEFDSDVHEPHVLTAELNDTEDAPLTSPQFHSYRVKNLRAYGKSEINLIQDFIFAIAALIEMDKKLSDGHTKVEDFLQLPPVPPLPPPDVCNI